MKFFDSVFPCKRLEMLMKAILVIVSGCFSITKAETPFCSGDLCYIRPNPNSGATWMAAQQKCKDINSTLPIADNPDHKKCFLDALSNFNLNNVDVWLGAIASDYGAINWRWLDGSNYIGSDVQERGEYYKSYAYISKKSATVMAYASSPNSSRSYICQYNPTNPDVCTNNTGRTAFVMENRCYVKHSEALSWFSARNNCLSTDGDLASFSQLSLADGIIDSSEYWVGLRHSQWNWQNAVTGSSLDVTLTSWAFGQPNDAAPHCIAVFSGDFPNWKDFDCTAAFPYICQVVNMMNPPSTTRTTTSFVSSTSASSTSSSLGAPGRAGTSTSQDTSSQLSGTTESDNNAHSNPVATSVAVGVGIGIPCAIIIIALIVTVIVQQRKIRQLRRYIIKYKSEDSNGKEPKENTRNSQATVLQPVRNDAEENLPYQHLQTQTQMQDQRQYEQLPPSQYEEL